MEESKGTVCVTGGTGFIASWLIMRLLQQGYFVRTTVRSHPEKKRDLSFLTTLPGSSEKLQIFNADLNDPDSFEEAIKGCTGVFHVAAPMDFEGKESEQVLTERTINGTLGILKACLKCKTVKRVVFTSSAAAVTFNGKNVDIMDESFWSSDQDHDIIKFPYAKTYTKWKTLSERAALQFAEETGLDLVTLILPYVAGPFICPKLPGSVHHILAMLFGNREGYSFLLNAPMVHVDDMARANIFLLEHPEAKGRYICSSHELTIQQMSEFLSAKYPEYSIPTVESLSEIEGFKLPGLSSKKLLDTGFKFKYGLDEIYDGAVQCCKEKGYL
ncbi:hypothetical protein QYF36_012325 [Acer negundo]|nr:hypothetical protein QYF36_012325 [Acer negundo]